MFLRKFFLLVFFSLKICILKINVYFCKEKRHNYLRMKHRIEINIKTLLAIVFLGFWANDLLAQKVIVKGEVKDEHGVYLLGATVAIKGTKWGVTTDLEGTYSIGVDVGQTLVFSFIGMRTEERRVTAKTTQINVFLKEDVEVLEDVVVMGYGTAKKIGTIAGSVTKISGEEIVNKPSASLLDALQGRVAGLSIFSTSGEPSDVANVRLHGSGSIFGRTDPLFVLDGTPVSKQVAILINPTDIESVSVLKDASATSIYGTRAANGVIYISTRRGKSSEPASITFNSQYGFSSLAGRKFFDDMMTAEEYADLLVEKKYKTRDEADELLKAFPNRVRWDRVFFKDNAPTQQLSLSAMGGGSKTRYYISGGYYSQEGLMYRSGFDRYTLRANIDAEINSWFRTSLKLSSGYAEYMVNPNVGDKLSASQGSLAILMPPIYSPVDEKGKRYDYIPIMEVPHPHYWAENNPSTSKKVNFSPQLSVTITPLKGLYLKSEGGVQYVNLRNDNHSYPSFIEEENKRSVANIKKAYTSKQSVETLIKTLTNTLEYQFDLNKNHSFNLLAGQETLRVDYSSFVSRSEGQISDRAIMLRHGIENVSASDGQSVTTFNSFFGRLNYGYTDKYSVDLSVRRDGSSRFGKNNRYANFWAVGFLWKARQEKFFKESDWLDKLDVKFSIGTSGNSDVVSDYTSLFQIRNNEFYKNRTGYLLSTPGNADLQWQKQLKTTLGLSVGMFKIIDLAVELYDRRTTNMLSSVYRPSYSGTTGIVENAGELQNRGIDVNLSFNLFGNSKRKFHLSPYVTFNYNQEKILSLHGGKAYMEGELSPVSFVVGEPLLYFYPIFQKINPDTGYAQWYVPGDDIVKTTTDDSNVTTTFDSDKLKQNTGIKRNPPLNGGFGLNMGYKTFSLNTLFVFSSGKYMINNDRYHTENPVGTTAFLDNNQNRIVLDSWKKPGDITRFPSLEHKLPFTQHDNRLIEDASFIRLKEVTLSYLLPLNVIQRVGFFRNIRVFSSARNLLTFTKYTGIDPEYDIPIAASDNPITKEYTFGIEFKF